MSRRNMPRVWIHGNHNKVYYWNTAVKILNEHYPNMPCGHHLMRYSAKNRPPQAARKDRMRGDTAYITGAAKNMVKISYYSKYKYADGIPGRENRKAKYLQRLVDKKQVD